MNRIKITLLLLCLSLVAYAQKELTIKEISRTLDYSDENKACFEFISEEADLMIRSSLENFEKTQLADGTYSYKATLDLDVATKREFYITAPLAMDKKYEIRKLKPKEYIKVMVTLPKHALSVTEKENLVPSKSSNAIYQFLSNIPDMELTTSTGLKFDNKGKNDAAFFIYELTVPVADTPGLTVSIKAIGYDELTYNIEEVSQRVFGFFIFPAEACFSKNFELGNEYFKEGLYSEALNYYDQAALCNDINSGSPLQTNRKKVENCKKIRNQIDQYDRNRSRLKDNLAVTVTMDSAYWYANSVIDLMRVLLKLNPADNFCSPSEIQKRENELLNGSRILVGQVVDSEFQNQVIHNVIIYGSERSDDKKDRMTNLGQSGEDGNFVISVPNKFKVLYFEDPRKVFKDVKVDITDGKRYSHRVQLRRKGNTVGI